MPCLPWRRNIPCSRHVRYKLIKKINIRAIDKLALFGAEARALCWGHRGGWRTWGMVLGPLESKFNESECLQHGHIRDLLSSSRRLTHLPGHGVQLALPLDNNRGHPGSSTGASI
ncbi:hypothetical protein J6590_017733 [Homalodisca vitripennis]|nr:hypothetical protein J6590_017733 [Homalodisca vitripennis]